MAPHYFEEEHAGGGFEQGYSGGGLSSCCRLQGCHGARVFHQVLGGVPQAGVDQPCPAAGALRRLRLHLWLGWGRHFDSSAGEFGSSSQRALCVLFCRGGSSSGTRTSFWRSSRRRSRTRRIWVGRPATTSRHYGSQDAEACRRHESAFGRKEERQAQNQTGQAPRAVTRPPALRKPGQAPVTTSMPRVLGAMEKVAPELLLYLALQMQLQTCPECFQRNGARKSWPNPIPPGGKPTDNGHSWHFTLAGQLFVERYGDILLQLQLPPNLHGSDGKSCTRAAATPCTSNAVANIYIYIHYIYFNIYIYTLNIRYILYIYTIFANIHYILYIYTILYVLYLLYILYIYFIYYIYYIYSIYYI